MVDKFTICLVGPKSAGKSSLLQTFIDCIALGGHGYSVDQKISVQNIDGSEYADGQIVDRILDSSSGVYREYRNAFFVKQRQTDDTNEYYFRLKANGLPSDHNGGAGTRSEEHTSELQ